MNSVEYVTLVDGVSYLQSEEISPSPNAFLYLDQLKNHRISKAIQYRSLDREGWLV